MDYKIYKLLHPRTNQILYVGYTSQSLKACLDEHQTKSSMNPKRAIHRYIRDYKIIPNIKLLEECSAENVKERQKHYILQFRSEGVSLLNH
jgi:hypothetical protein